MIATSLQMLVGESFAMKTAAYRILQAALTDMNAAGEEEFKTKVYTINPKSITMQQLYGADDPGANKHCRKVMTAASFFDRAILEQFPRSGQMGS
jgi:dynein heavy chain, axonemal